MSPWTPSFQVIRAYVDSIIPIHYYLTDNRTHPFIGVVARPVGGDFPSSDIQYQTLRLNVDILKLIQLGLSFTDKDGNLAEGCTCWQFNFKFSLTDDMFAQDSIELLKLSGIDFIKFENYGIDIHYFGELMMMSGLVLNEDVKWVSFHSSYDFGYLLKTLTCHELPLEEPAFLDLLHLYFPCLYDVKYMMTSVEGMYGGLSSLADTLQVGRIGPMHQAGSDSLLTAHTYFMLLKKHSNNVGDDSKFRGSYLDLEQIIPNTSPRGSHIEAALEVYRAVATIAAMLTTAIVVDRLCAAAAMDGSPTSSSPVRIQPLKCSTAIPLISPIVS